MVKIVKLSTYSWFLKNNNGGILGVLNKKTDNTFQLLTTNSKHSFNTLEDVEKEYGKIKGIEETSKVSDITNINGYPVKHADITVIDENIPTYSRGTKVYFVAGYWGIRNDSGWSMIFCPKLSTIQSSEHIGPYKNKMEILNEISMKNNMENLGKF